MDLLHTTYQRNLGINDDFDLSRTSGHTDHHGYRPGFYGTHPYGASLANSYRTEYQNGLQAYNEGTYLSI